MVFFNFTIQKTPKQFMETRPKLNIKLTLLDWIIELVALVSVILLLILPIYYYDILPDKIPRHFNAQGKPDAYGNKSSLWVLPVISVLLYLFMTIINRFAHTFNYPQKITAENAQKQYRMATRMIRIVKAIIGVGFPFISFRTIQIALGKRAHLGQGFTLLFVGSLGVVITYFLVKALKQKKST